MRMAIDQLTVFWNHSLRMGFSSTVKTSRSTQP
jgi:hypothetical protein